MKLPIDEAYLATTTQTLVRINSINPDLAPGAPAEAEAGRFIADRLHHLGLEPVTHDLGNDRVNVVATLKGASTGKSLMLNAHLDTVGVAGMANPFDGSIREGKLYGRGSYDMKASAVAQLAVAKALLDSGTQLAGDLILAFVADEEYASIGTEHIAATYKADGAIVTEPTGLSVCIAHRGFVWYEIVTIGHAAHGSRYEEGIDANSHMGRVLVELEGLSAEFRTRPQHPLVGQPSLHAAQIEGGVGISTYAEKCTLKVERRLNPGETEAAATAEIQTILDRLKAADPQFNARITPFFARNPFETAAVSPLVNISDAAIAARLGEEMPHIGTLGWTDAALLADAGMESILLGPSGTGAHAAVEWVEMASVVDLTHILVDIAGNYCGTG